MEELEVVANLSEDEHSPTDTSEDSVEVRVTPIRLRKDSASPRLPHKLRKHYAATFARTQQRLQSPPESQQSSPGSPPPVLSEIKSEKNEDEAVLRVARSHRRKIAEPRRVLSESEPVTPQKRPSDENSSSKPIKLARLEPEVISSPSAVASPLHHPFFSTFAASPAAIQPLLLNTPWAQVAVGQYPYARLVPPIGLLPAGLSPVQYPLIPFVSPSYHPLAPPLIFRPPSSASPHSSDDFEKPVKVERLSPQIVNEEVALRREAVDANKLKSADASSSHKTSKFFSVETLLSTDESCSGVPELNKQEDTIQSLLQQSKQKQRNYKNMTRERRIEANARERTRVHTISAAFEKLRQAIPSYSHNQKLSKLSILRIACTYILSLSRLAGHDYSLDGTEPSFSECVDLMTKTIQTEGKAKKKRED